MSSIMFNLQLSSSASREQLAIIKSAALLGHTYEFTKACSPNAIPIGDVPYCEAVFGEQPSFKNFYPEFMRSLISRNVLGFNCHQYEFGCPIFVKSAREWKCDFESRVYQAGESIPSGNYFISNVVKFVNEWRYYVADGKVVTSGWYAGENEDLAVPSLNVEWPKGWSGAVDIGTLDDGRLELVEAHAPFACGWYGDDPSLYALWQIVAWKNRQHWLILTPYEQVEIYRIARNFQDNPQKVVKLLKEEIGEDRLQMAVDYLASVAK